MSVVSVDLRDLGPFSQLSSGLRDGLLEAARVMLDRFHQSAPVDGKWLRHSEVVITLVHWDASTAVMQTSHGNLKDATEDGAYALAIIAASLLGYRVLGRTPQGSGSDWHLEHPTDPQRALKLEVSGIAEGGSPGSRLEQKLIQGQKGVPKTEGVAIVFRFADASIYSKAWT